MVGFRQYVGGQVRAGGTKQVDGKSEQISQRQVFSEFCQKKKKTESPSRTDMHRIGTASKPIGTLKCRPLVVFIG